MRYLIVYVFLIMAIATPSLADGIEGQPNIHPPKEEHAMGQIQPTTNKNVYKISLSNADGSVIGEISITGMYSNHESWDHLKGEKDVPAKPAGPDNRMVIETFMSWSASWGYHEVTTKEEEQSLKQIVDDFNQHQGVVAANDAIIAADDPAFEGAFLESIKAKYGMTATFVAGEK